MDNVPNRAPNYGDIQKMVKSVVSSQKSDNNLKRNNRKLSPERLMELIPLRVAA